jgi:hypothetical protein
MILGARSACQALRYRGAQLPYQRDGVLILRRKRRLKVAELLEELLLRGIPVGRCITR